MWVLYPLGHYYRRSSMIYSVRGGCTFRPHNKTSWVFLVVLKWIMPQVYHTLDDDERHLYHHKSISLLTHQSIFMSIVGYVVNSAPISESSIIISNIWYPHRIWCVCSLTCDHHLDHQVLLFKKIWDTKDLERHIRWTYDDIHIINCWLSYRICFLSLQRLT